MRRIILGLAAVAVIAAAVVLWATRPRDYSEADVAGLDGDVAAGESVFWASGCTSCHAAPNGDDPLILAGGDRLESDFGTFVVPNISTDPENGIGDWTLAEFASALHFGTGPGGQHYYPALPYASYGRMALQDIADLKAFMDTLPADPTPSAPHELGFPFNIRLGLGLWKAVGVNSDWVRPAEGAEAERGRYLVEALAHCGECHTPRNVMGVMDRSRWMAGAPNPSGRGRIPGLTPTQLDWSAGDIVYYFETGFTPDFDSVGGSMASVVKNMQRLSADDRAAIAAYVKALPGAE